MRWRWVALLALVCAAALAGCGGSRPPAITSVRVSRINEYTAAQGAAPQVLATLDNRATAQVLYDTLEALPAFPLTLNACPLDYGIVYHVTFYAGATDVLDADADPAGCQTIVLYSHIHFQADERQASAAFWAALAGVSGVSVPALMAAGT